MEQATMEQLDEKVDAASYIAKYDDINKAIKEAENSKTEDFQQNAGTLDILEQEVQSFRQAWIDKIVEGQQKARKVKQRLEFENRVGVDLYNIDTRILSEPLPEDKQGDSLYDVASFFIHYHAGPDPLESLCISGENIYEQLREKLLSIYESEILTFLRILPKESAEYRRLVNKAINAEQPTTTEFRFIRERYRRSISLNKEFQEVPSMGLCGIFGHAYRFLCRLYGGSLEARTCAAPECQRLFIPTPGGSEQLYCQHACKMRAYRWRKKKAMAAI